MTETTPSARRRGHLLLLVAVLALVAVADGVYLTLAHVDYEFGKPSELVQVCGKLASRGCAVTTGRFGDLMGIPVSVLGMAGAAATAVAAAMGYRQRRAAHDPWRGTTFGLAAFSVLASMLMAVFSLVEGSFCPMCVAWYGLNAAMGLFSWHALGDAQDRSLATMLRDAMGAPGTAVVAAFFLTFSAGYWMYGEHRASVRAEYEQLTNALVDQILAEVEPVEVSLEGLPTKGPDDATLTVVEIADFQCPHCRRLWEGIAGYSEQSANSVRVAFVHFPLDDSCNPGVQGIHPLACEAAKAAECARAHDKFFDYGDLLFEHQPAFEREQLVGYATELGIAGDEFAACLDDEQTTLAVKRSIARAILLDIEATPTFFVNGYKFGGAKPKEWISLVFDKLAVRGAKGRADTSAR